MTTVHLQTLGCRLNQAESERMARGFRLAGYKITDDAKSADIRVVNTCTVTKNAGDDSRNAAKPLHANQKIVITGCHSEVKPEDFADADLIVANAEKESLSALVQERFGMDGLALGMDMSRERSETIYPLALAQTRAFIKIQDGCNLRCSFCLTTVARGVSRSREADEIISEIRDLKRDGCQEAVLTGVHAGSYGLDLDRDFGWLINRILAETAIPRLRLSSLEPWNFKKAWVPLWERYEGRLCRHLHMSLQSGSNSVLRRMNRHYDQANFAKRLAWARKGIPGIAITTDIICGFPGETEEEHAESLAFVKEINLAGAHIFTYSPRPGTQAAEMPDHLPADIKKQRYREMSEVVDATESAFRQSHIGTTQNILWEKTRSDGNTHGLTDTYMKVLSPSPMPANTLSAHTISGEENGSLRIKA